jgi:hypothetical protein
MKTTIQLCMTAILAIAPVLAQTVKQDLKNAGTETKHAFKETGKATKRTAGKVKNKSQHAVHKTSSKVANKTAGH